MLAAMDAFQALQTRNQEYYTLYDAWYTGDDNKLKATSKDGQFWRQTKRCTRKVHVPIAAEIATVSADLLFAEPPSILISGDEEQKRLYDILSQNDLMAKLYAAAEWCAAYGDVFLKINWDKEKADVPLINIVSPMLAYPEYDYDLLEGVHFFCKTKKTNTKWEWMHEYYEKKKLYVTYGQGDSFAPQQFGETIETKVPSDRLLCTHIKNMTPNRNAGAMNQGRSDYEGVIGMMDALDEAYSSWLRDVNLGKARLVVPSDYFRRDHNPIRPGEYIAHFDKEDEVFVAMDIDPDRANGTGIVESQFDIRSAQHRETCEAYTERVITAAGYSPQTFGINISGRAESGTALNIRERKTYTTKAKKELYWRRSLEEFVKTIIEVDGVVFKHKYEDSKITIEFKEPAQDINNIAEAINKLASAGAISTYEMIKRANPEWDDEQIQEELKRIQTDKGMFVDEEFVYNGEIDEDEVNLADDDAANGIKADTTIELAHEIEDGGTIDKEKVAK